MKDHEGKETIINNIIKPNENLDSEFIYTYKIVNLYDHKLIILCYLTLL